MGIEADGNMREMYEAAINKAEDENERLQNEIVNLKKATGGGKTNGTHR